MKRKSFLALVLSMLLVISSAFAVGCGNNNKEDEPQTPPQSQDKEYTIFFDDLALLNGQSFNLDAKLLLDGVLLDATFSYSSADASTVSVANGVATAKKLGNTSITVTASYEGSEVANKTVNCSVGANEGIVPDAHEYLVYISGEVLGETYPTEQKLEVDVFKDGNKLDGAIVNWKVGDESIVSVSDGVLKALKVGKTYVEGTYENLKTIQIPVEVAIPVLKSDMNVVIDTRKELSPIDPNVILGNGKVVGNIVEAETGVELSVSNNAVATKGLRVGEYRYVVYDKLGVIGCEVNLIVADYVVNSKADFFELGYNSSAKYVAFTTDLHNVGNYVEPDIVAMPAEQHTFKGVFNGLGHTVEGLNMATNASGIFGKCGGGTFKNIAFTNAKISASNSGIFFFQSTSGADFDNVYVEVVEFAGDSWSSGALYGFNYHGKTTIKNSIIIANGAALVPNNKGVMYSGAISGRAKDVPFLENTYVISKGLLVADGITTDPHNQAYPNINVLPVIYKTEEEFVNARNENKSPIDLTSFGSFWDLSKDVPCFK